jgi:hypothetical protein
MIFNRLNTFLFFFGIVLISMLGSKLLIVVYGKRVQAEIVGFNSYSLPKGGSYYKPIVQFKTNDKTIEFETTSNTSYSTNEKVIVLYFEEDLKSAVVFSFFGIWWPRLIYLLIPLVILVSLFAGLMAKDEIIYINFKKKPFFRKMKRIEFEIIRKDEFDAANSSTLTKEELENLKPKI